MEEKDANSVWVRTAASDPRCSDETINAVLDLRFGEDRVGYVPPHVQLSAESTTYWNRVDLYNEVWGQPLVKPSNCRRSTESPMSG
jgi:hypothetical protein